MNVSLLRKVIYIVAIVVLLVPLVLLSAPATYQDGQQRPGGILARLRAEHRLSQSTLGNIDPASEAMRMASLGLRGVAANVLWSKAFHYQKVEDYDALRATLNQITNLQPNFISVWEFQAHNLSYNCSVEFDDYRSRYHWIKKGIDFLLTGIQYNRDEPKLLWTIGWYLSQKIGRADEKVAFRRLFREDGDFLATIDRPYIEVDSPEAKGPDGRPDNWLVGRLWFVEAQRVVDTLGAPLRGKSPLIFNSNSAMTMINYATAIESEGYLDEKAQYAWRRAGEEWERFGDRSIPTSWGVNIRLNDRAQATAEVLELEKQLEELAPGVRELLFEEKLAKLSDEEREAMDVPEAELASEEQYILAMTAKRKTQVEYREIAARAPESQRVEAKLVARNLENKVEHRRRIERYRGIVNYDYWKNRCEVEQTDTAIKARRYVFEADKLWEKASFEAKDRYEAAWDEWAAIMDKYPSLYEDVTAENLVDAIKRYRVVIEQLGEEWPPEDFKLTELLRVRALKYADTSLGDFTNVPPKRSGAKTPETDASKPGAEDPKPETDAPKSGAEDPKAETDAPKPGAEDPKPANENPDPAGEPETDPMPGTKAEPKPEAGTPGDSPQAGTAEEKLDGKEELESKEETQTPGQKDGANDPAGGRES